MIKTLFLEFAFSLLLFVFLSVGFNKCIHELYGSTDFCIILVGISSPHAHCISSKWKVFIRIFFF